MRALFFLCFVLPLFAQAEGLMLPREGKYSYRADFSVIQKQRYESVYGFVEKGKARLAQLRSEGYRCSNKGREIYLCNMQQPKLGAENEIRESVQHKMRDRHDLEFFELEGSPNLVSDGESVKIWDVPQKVNYAGVTYEKYRYLVSPNIHKIFLGEPAEHTFNIGENGALRYPLLLPLTESREVYFTYFVEGFFRM